MESKGLIRKQPIASTASISMPRDQKPDDAEAQSQRTSGGKADTGGKAEKSKTKQE